MTPLAWIPSGIGALETLIKTMFGSRQERDSASADENAAALAQYASEFRAIGERTAWDSFVDGLNRLQRPSYTFSLLALFWLAYAKPAAFLQVMTGFAMVPEPFWVMTGIIIGFLFSSRMIEKLPVYKAFQGIGEKEIHMLQPLLERRLSLQAPAMDTLPSGNLPWQENPSVAQWKKQQEHATP